MSEAQNEKDAILLASKEIGECMKALRESQYGTITVTVKKNKGMYFEVVPTTTKTIRVE